MKRAIRGGVPVVVSALGLALLSGCGATSGSAKPTRAPLPPASPTVTVVSSVLQMKFPDDAYQPSTLQLAEARYLSQRLTQVCMKGLGFDYLPTLSTAMIASSDKTEQEFKSRLYGVSDAAAAATYGYHLPTWTSGTGSAPMPSKLPGDERAVLDGQGPKTYGGKAVPTGGCLRQSADLLRQAGVGTDSATDGSQAATVTPRTIEVEAFEDAQRDPRVIAVNAKWSSCMAGFGYHYSSPLSALGDQVWTTTAAAGQTEVQTAKRDIACQQQVNLLDIEYDVQSGYEKAAMEKNPQTMKAAKTGLSAETAGLDRLMKQYAE